MKPRLLLPMLPLLAASVVARPQAQGQPVNERVPLKIGVEHQHKTGSCKGELTVDKWRFSYTSQDRPEDSRTWKLTDIKEVESKTPAELVLKTREESVKGFGGDRNYKFKVPGAGIERAVVDFMIDRVG